MDESTAAPIDLDAWILESRRVMEWVHSKLNGLQIPALAEDKRRQLACACWFVSVEHSMAIVVLVDDKLYGSALALVRPLFEAYVRGLWLLHSATPDDVDRAGNDKFPRDFDKMIADLDASGQFAFSQLKVEWWSRMCSFTHTGYQQIGARLTPEGLGDGYERSEIDSALQWADAMTLMCVVAFANVVNNQPLASEVWEYFRSHFPSSKPADAPQASESA
jgi:hypothetical protein